MSSRAPRRSFATPFVLTLAAIPACTVQSGPAPQGPTQREARNDQEREPKHVNPPKPQPQEPQPQPDMTPVANPPRPDNANANANTGVNDQVKGTANPTPPVTQSRPDTTPKARGYREWTVSKANGTCSSMVKVNCPDGAMCNPPPPAKYECPKFMADNDKIAIVQQTEKAECFVDHGDFKCPPTATCNPPRPQKVTCPK